MEEVRGVKDTPGTAEAERVVTIGSVTSMVAVALIVTRLPAVRSATRIGAGAGTKAHLFAD
jgi:hypothetical protein